MVDVVIRPETSADHEAIRRVNQLAFGQPDEARLVDALRDGDYVRLSLVAECHGQVVGHLLLSAIEIVSAERSTAVLSLAPMAVVPSQQGQGIGTALVSAALAECRAAGHKIVIVVGHPGYYPRFGFSAQLASHWESDYAGEAFMVWELVPGAAKKIVGAVRYSPPFASL